MKIVKKELSTIQPVFNTNVYDNKNYITNNNIINHNCVVDYDYTGEVHLSLINTSTDVISISENEKIIQFILLPVPASVLLKEDSLESLYDGFDTERGFGAFGSTNHK